MRASQRDHLWAFKRYLPNADCYYVNLGFGKFPFYLHHIDYDLIIFDWSFVGLRTARLRFQQILKKIDNLKKSNAIKICMPQDEFTSMDLLCDMINDFKINYVFSVAPPSEWKKIYRDVNFEKVKYFQVLTGYLEDSLVQRWINNPVDSNRPIDIGYRTVSTAIWGRFNLLKASIANLFLTVSEQNGLKHDIKIGAEYFKVGDEWLRFLSKCRYTLGIEGGSRILDWDGSILAAVCDYLDRNPDAIFDELAQTCVPVEREGEINVIAISPRHLEACLTRTVQILVEGNYNGILKPDVHYIPLKSDFSNIDNVLSRISDEAARSKMAENAIREIVLSNNYTYHGMVDFILNKTGLDCFHKNRESYFFKLAHKLHGLFLYIELFVVFNITLLRTLRSWTK